MLSEATKSSLRTHSARSRVDSTGTLRRSWFDGRTDPASVEFRHERYGIDAKLFDLEPEADCARKIARNDYDPCGARCPDLAKVVELYRTIFSDARESSVKRP